MNAPRVALAGAAGLILAGAALAPIGAGAGSPGSISVSPGSSATYTGSVGPGWPDPAGPPAPGCPAGQCDHETVDFTTGGDAYPAFVFSLAVALSFTPSDAAGQNCLDVAIENSTASTVYGSSQCVGSGAIVTAAGLHAGGTYIVEVDADGSDAAALSSQSFSATVTGGASPAPTGGGTATNPATFTHEVTVDPQRADGEPDVAISQDGQDMYTATPYGFSTTISFAWKSSDGGVRWTNLHGACAANLLRPDCSRGGGDAEVELGTAQSGNPQTVQFTDLNGLDTISCAYSTNGGDTFNDIETNPSTNTAQGQACNLNTGGNTGAVTNPPGTDRPWMAVWPASDNGTASDKLYMVYDTGETPPGGDASIYSNDGGQTWNTGCTTLTLTSCVGGSGAVGSRPGPLLINPTLTNTILGVTYPTLYEFMGTSNNGTEVNISCDGGQTWSNVQIGSGMAGSTTNDFVAGAIDSAGNLYSAWSVNGGSGTWATYYSHSSDGAGTPGVGNCSAAVPGDHWTTPVAINGSGTTVSNASNVTYAVMPWITAGDPGRVDIVYYGSTASGISPQSTPADWFLRMAQTTNGLDANPVFSDVQATESPMHTSSICFNGIGCTGTGDRNLLDFFQVKPDPVTGRAVIIFTDDNNSAQGPTTVGFNGAGIISEVQQASGSSLYASIGSVPPLPASGLGQSTDQRNEVTAPAGDAELAGAAHNLVGTKVPAADITDLKVVNKDANTLAFIFTVRDLSGGPASAVVTPHTGANWLATWHWNNDLWFAQATTDATGTVKYIAGRPLSIYNDGEPKALQYTTDGNSEATTVTGGYDTAHNTIEIDVPLSAIGGVDTAGDTTDHVLRGLTGWTGADNAAVSSSTIPDTTFSGPVAFFDNIDQTAPIDVNLAAPAASTPEAPSIPLLAGLGGLAVAGGAALRRRRRRAATR
jgi:hypothetical protein